jgi:hypothetical protein
MSITRAEVLHRAATIWPLGHVEYSMFQIRNPGYRLDCSGFVALCLKLPTPGPNTVGLVTEGFIHEIGVADLQPADLVGCCGPGTDGAAGHVVVFDHWTEGHSRYMAYEFTPGLGPAHREIAYPYDGLSGFRPWRYKGIAGASPVPGKGKFVTVKSWPDPASTISGIAAQAGIPDWKTIWNDQKNAGLRAHRGVPEHVQPGDAVWVPA